MRYGVLYLLLGVSALAAVDGAKAPAVEHRLPVLASVFPQGAQPGQTVTVELLGQYLDRSAHALFSGGEVRAKLLSVSSTRLSAEFTVPGDARFGHHQFRVITPRGASNPVLFRVGDLPHHLEREPNSALDEAEIVTVPATINARLGKDNDFDFFRFRAQAGETWVFDLRSARNGNGLDAALILLDASGRKLDHDEDTFIWDPFLVHKFAATGDYVAAVQPTHARNDPNFAYQLDIRRSAHLATVSPLALAPGATTEVTLFGRALLDPRAAIEFSHPGIRAEILQARGDSAAARITVPAGVKPGSYELTVVSHGRSNPATFLVDEKPIAETARYREPHRFPVRVAAGDAMVFEVRAMRFGSPVDAHLRVLDVAGKQVAANDDATFAGVPFNKDPKIVHTFKEGGTYYVEVRNVSAVTGEDYPYQLVMGKAQPAYELQIASDQPFLHPGETRKLKIAVERVEGHKDEIPLTVEGLPQGVTLKTARIPAGETEGVIELEAAAGLAPGAFSELAIRDARGAEAWKTGQVSSGGGEGRAWVRVNRAYLVVAEKPLFSLECAFTNLNLVRGGTAQLKVMIRREPGFASEIQFSAENLPAGVSLEGVEATADLATLRFRATNDAQLGRAARVSILGRASGQLQEAPRISFLVD